MSRADVVDVDAVQMLWILRRMRDEGKYVDGRKLAKPPSFFLGAAASPFASRPEFQALREEKKINAGAQFFQTNLVFDPDGLDIWLNEMAKRNILDKVYILAGITPLKSVKMAEYMRDGVAGLSVPDALIKRLADAGDPKEEGHRIAVEQIQEVREIPGVSGVHIMAIGAEKTVRRIVEDAGLLPRPAAA